MTPEQAEAVRAQGSVWVTASAGTGKTAVLVQRILYILLSGVAPSRVLALTFTNAACLEMHDRLFAALRAWANEPILEPLLGRKPLEVERKRAQGLWNRCVEAGPRVQTFHAFCRSWIPMGSTVLDDAHTLLRRASLEALNAFPAAEQDLLHTRFSQETLFRLAESAVKLRLHTTETPLPVPPPPPFQRRCAGIDTLFLTQSGEKRARLLPAAVQKTHPKLTKLLQKEQEAFWAWTLEMENYTGNVVERWAHLAVDLYQKGKNGAYEYDDVMEQANVFFGNAGWVEEKVGDPVHGLSHVLVDEAQDSSAVQWRVVNALATALERSDGGTLTVVGDPKQSVFRFQGADLQAYQQAFRPGMKRVKLETSFRSAPAVLDFVNKTFEGKTLGGERVQHRPCEKKRFEAGKAETWEGASPEDMAKRVRSWIEVGCWTVQDIFVLVRRRGPAARAVLDAFNNAGLCVNETLWHANQENLETLLAAGVLALFPNNEAALVQVLKALGWTMDRLVSLCQSRRGPLWEAVKTPQLSRLVAAPMHSAVAFFLHLASVLNVWTGLEGLFHKAETWEGDVFSLIVYVQTHGVESVPAPVSGEGVRFLTVHGAKGLQAPVVLVVWESDAHVHEPLKARNGRLAWIPPAAHRSEDLNAWLEEEHRLLEEESQRLLYVALTRAEQELYFVLDLVSKKNLL